MATGTSVLVEVPCVLAGIQRGSSVRSHQSGGATGSSRTCALSCNPPSRADRRCNRPRLQMPRREEDRGNGQCLKEGSHEGETEVYPACGCLQEIPAFRTPGGVKPGVKDVGWWERREYSSVSGFTPPSLLGVNAGSRWFYSTQDEGFCTSSGNPAIFVLQNARSSDSNPPAPLGRRRAPHRPSSVGNHLKEVWVLANAIDEDEATCVL